MQRTELVELLALSEALEALLNQESSDTVGTLLRLRLHG